MFLKIKGLSSPPTAISCLKNAQVHQSGFPSANLHLLNCFPQIKIPMSYRLLAHFYNLAKIVMTPYNNSLLMQM